MNKFRSAILGGAGMAPSNPLVTDKNGHDAEGNKISSVAIPRDAARAADHRDEDRHRLARETAIIGYKGKKKTIDLINLSGGGAMIEADLSPRLWDRIDLYLGDGSPIECAVRWIRGGRIGLEFAHETRIECDDDKRATVLLDVLRRSFPDLVVAAPAVVPEAAPAPAPRDDSRRGAVRHPLIWNGEILWQHDVHPVRLRNISATGALIEAQVTFPTGVELMLDLGPTGQLFAKVGWARGGQAGLIFEQPFDIALLAAAKPAVAPRQWDRPSYLDDRADAGSPWASEWERSELSDLQADLEGFLKR